MKQAQDYPSKKNLVFIIGHFLRHPITIFLSIVLGVVVGIWAKELVPFFRPFSSAFGNLLTLCLLPIMFCSIVCGLANIVRSKRVIQKMTFVLLIFAMSFSLPAIVGLVVGAIGSPKSIISHNAEVYLGRIIDSSIYVPPLNTDSETNDSKKQGSAAILDYIIPKNIFAELSSEFSIKIVFIAIALGLVLGTFRNTVTRELLRYLDLTRSMFERLFDWVLYILPIALIGSFSSSFSKMDFEIIKLLILLVLLLYVAGGILMILYNVVLAFSTRQSFIATLKMFKHPLLLGFILEDALIPLPKVFPIFSKIFGKEDMSRFLMPLGTIINQQGKILLFTIMTILISNFYNIHLGANSFLILFALSVLMGFAAVGKFSMIAPMYLVICKSIGLPADIGLLILSSIGPFVMRLTETITLYGNCAVVAWIQHKGEGKHE